jgi:hypothetical protein
MASSSAPSTDPPPSAGAASSTHIKVYNFDRSRDEVAKEIDLSNLSAQDLPSLLGHIKTLFDRPPPLLQLQPMLRSVSALARLLPLASPSHHPPSHPHHLLHHHLGRIHLPLDF